MGPMGKWANGEDGTKGKNEPTMGKSSLHAFIAKPRHSLLHVTQSSLRLNDVYVPHLTWTSLWYSSWQVRTPIMGAVYLKMLKAKSWLQTMRPYVQPWQQRRGTSGGIAGECVPPQRPCQPGPWRSCQFELLHDSSPVVNHTIR